MCRSRSTISRGWRIRRPIGRDHNNLTFYLAWAPSDRPATRTCVITITITITIADAGIRPSHAGTTTAPGSLSSPARTDRPTTGSR
ncbi:hypothetical protein FRAAL4625 [Frankia alni ACN14a]|uniref:Uncharacterized protein n=1 Tax=Frankia alni (strain DSM 45986 / CECT 9034 / ACN14a) TaxID=326424 RepID=Q0RGW9_FRAAA|nr:hypothetical protein FRAAL4625 [Frankia alni ACN14a]